MFPEKVEEKRVVVNNSDTSRNICVITMTH